ncbi:MAG: Do family serine endopeptidase [Planctomycetaceae bacterium]
MNRLRATLIAFSVFAVTTGVLTFAGVACAQTALQVPRTAESDGFAKAYELSDAFRTVSRNVLPAVVSIRTEGRVVKRQVADFSPFQSDPFLRRFFNDPRLEDFMDQQGGLREREFRTPGGQGSGFIIDSSGLVLTNAHVVAGSDNIIVQLGDGREFPVVDVKADERADVALLKIQVPEPLASVPLGNDDAMEIGDWVLAFGSPFGMHHSVTQGIISAKGRGLGGDPNKEFLQTDAAVNPGNSGGPLVNLRGEVVGINTAISTRSGGYDGVSLAIPVNLVKWVTDQLRTNGKVQRAYVGIQMQTIDAQLARSFNLTVPQGVVVTEVVKDSPADKAGFQQGDVILEVDGRSVRSPLNMLGVVERLSVGQTYRIKVLRDGTERELKITVAERPGNFAALEGKGSGESEPGGHDGTKVNELGIAVQELSQDIADQLGVAAGSGVVITSVSPGSVAARVGLEPGMIVVSMGNRPVKTVQDVQDEVEKARKSGQILLLVKKSDGVSNVSRFFSVPLN